MENPCLTFVTPTLLAGDRSLANVVAHEIAHSWTGNLVTNSSWESFWWVQRLLGCGTQPLQADLLSASVHAAASKALAAACAPVKWPASCASVPTL